MSNIAMMVLLDVPLPTLKELLLVVVDFRLHHNPLVVGQRPLELREVAEVDNQHLVVVKEVTEVDNQHLSVARKLKEVLHVHHWRHYNLQQFAHSPLDGLFYVSFHCCEYI